VTEVVAVLDHAGRQRLFARALTAAFRGQGVDLCLRTHRDLVAEVTVEQATPGGPPSLEPDRALLWLSPADPASGVVPMPEDERFLAAEVASAARSIAMLTRSPVLNRPTAISPCGEFPAGAVAAVRGVTRVAGLAASVRPERFTAGPGDRDGVDEVYDYSTGRSSYGVEPATVGPVRRRPSVRRSRLARVRVVGDDAITSGTMLPGVADASRQVAAWYRLDLATVWWLVEEDAAATLARIDCWVWDRSAGDLAETAAAIAAWAGARLSGATIR
jgi:hypothetical protein